ncbi:response regulator [Petroclostridium sp. X23]|uniref:response regulator n=1 Tax=Petroclostridium sp. X23 TaxID=3045146 RepID=UPI0024ADCFEF|nr:response regulator [Petroclostridium sp. X23]WHH59093.1 response regulator [Petroclostridium sp. X23]
MYRVLVADDEKWIRKAIVKRVLSCGLAVKIAAEAEDGQEAYELALNTKPDIIITDIKMPCMNGLQLIERLKDQLPRTKFIIISGYADFEYARSALQLKVCQYILKTVDDHELREALEQAIQQIKDEDMTAGQINTLQTKLVERTHILQRHFIQQMVSSNRFSKEYTQRMVDNLGLPFEEDTYFCVLVLEIDTSITENQDINKMLNSISNFFTKYDYRGFVFENMQGYNELNILLYSADMSQLDKIHLFDLTKKLKEIFKKTFSLAGISNTYQSYLELNKAYIEAIDALKNKNLLKNKKTHCIYYQDIRAYDSLIDYQYFTAADERTLAYHIESGSIDDIASCITAVFDKIKASAQISTKILMKLYYEVILLLERVLAKYQLSVEDVLEVDFLSLINVPKTSTAEELETLLASFSTKVAQYLATLENDNPRIIFNNIKHYIDTNYFEPITLDSITQKFFISKTFFNKLFKKETNMTFVSYLTKIRMENALELLQHNQLKVNEVAKMVGYSDPLYFGQVFKKHFGVLPSEYSSNNDVMEEYPSL